MQQKMRYDIFNTISFYLNMSKDKIDTQRNNKMNIIASINENSYLESYNKYNILNNGNNINSLTYEQFIDFIYDYYNSDMSIDSVLTKHNINKSFKYSANKILPDFESELNCKYCNTKMINSDKSKTAYKQNFSRNHSFCTNCEHRELINNLCNCDNCKEEKIKENEKINNFKLSKLQLLVEEANKYKFPISLINSMSLKSKTYLLTFLMYLYNETDCELEHSFIQIESLEGISLAPTNEFIDDIVEELLYSHLIKFKINQNNLDRINFRKDSHNNYSFNLYESDFLLNIESDESICFSNIVKECEKTEALSTEHKIEILEEALNLWEKINLEELKEYTYYLFEKYNFNVAYIGNKIMEKLELIVEDFSVSQGYSILYSSITAAASYKQTGITLSHAINSINTYISNNIAKRKSGEWKTSGYKRNFDLPQSAISVIFFNNIIKIGNNGFEQVAKIENIPDDFIDFKNDIDNNIDKLLNEIMNMTNKNEDLKNDFSFFLKEFIDSTK